MVAIVLCGPCMDGDHDNHYRIVQSVPKGMFGGAVCICKGECGNNSSKSDLFLDVMDRMKKYADTGKVTVVTPEEHDQIEEGLNKLGKTTAGELTDKERHQVLDNPEK